MKKKILSIITLILSLTLILCIFSGCAGESTKTPDPISVPEGGWSKKELMSVTMINDRRVSSPPLYGEFSRNLEVFDMMVIEGDGYLYVPLTRQDADFGSFTFKISKKSDLKDSTPVDGIHIREYLGMASHQISINGLKFGDSKDKMLEVLGEPTKWVTRSESMAHYEFTDGGYMIIDLLGNKVYTVSLYGLTEKK